MSNFVSNVTLYHASLTPQSVTVNGRIYVSTQQGEIHSVPSADISALQALGFQTAHPRDAINPNNSPLKSFGNG